MEYLEPIYSCRSSFNKEAFVVSEDDKKILFSLHEKVCIIENGKASVKDLHTASDVIHVKEFLKQNGFKAKNKSQIIIDYFNKI